MEENQNQNTKQLITEKESECIWLNYFNKYLFENNVIDEHTRNVIKNRISAM